MKRNLITFLVVLAVAVLVWRPWRSRFGYHFDFPLPASARMVNYHHSWGRDSGDEFEFAVTDDTLRDAIIEEWNLRPALRPEDAKSWATITGAGWWPGGKLDQYPERYGRVDEGAARYWSLWFDPANGKLYAEYGNW